MEQEQKIKAILDAVNSRKYSGNELEPSRKGQTISRMKAGKTVTPGKVDEIYSRLMELDGQNGQQEHTQEQSEAIYLSDIELENARLKAENATLRKEIERMKEQVQVQVQVQVQEQTQAEKEQTQEQVRISELSLSVSELKAEMEELKNTVRTNQAQAVRIPDHEIIMGWHIRRKRAGNTTRLYANKSFNGKQHIIYIGDEYFKAEEKIRSYCAKKGLSPCQGTSTV